MFTIELFMEPLEIPDEMTLQLKLPLPSLMLLLVVANDSCLTVNILFLLSAAGISLDS